MDSFATRLCHLRESHELKKNELARILNVSPACVSQYERGDSIPGYDIICNISQYFGVSIDYLLGNKLSGLDVQLEDDFTKEISYVSLINLCNGIPTEKRDALLHIIKALR